MGAFYHDEKCLEDSLIASSNKRKGSVLYVPTLTSFSIIFYTFICVASYAEWSKIQDPGHLGQKMENADCFFHSASPLAEKRSQPRNPMLVQIEGDVAE